MRHWLVGLSCIGALAIAEPENTYSEGSQLYEEHCAQCHWSDGDGIVETDFSRDALLFKTDQALLQHLQYGGRACPSFEFRLQEKDLQNIIYFMRVEF